MRFAILSFILLSQAALAAETGALSGTLFRCYVVSTSEYGSLHSDPSWITVRGSVRGAVEVQIDFEDHQTPVVFGASIASDLTPAKMQRFTISGDNRTMTLLQDGTNVDKSVSAFYQYDHDGFVARGSLSCDSWPSSDGFRGMRQ